MVVEILDGGRLAEPGVAQPRLKSPLGPGGRFPIEQQAEPFLEVEFVDIGHGRLVQQRLAHAGQAQLRQLLKGWVIHHRWVLPDQLK